MSPDIRRALHDAAGTPRPRAGFDAIWRRSRRLRMRKWIVLGLGTISAAAFVFVAVSDPPSDPKLPPAGVSSSDAQEDSRRAISVRGHPIALAVGEDAVWVGAYELAGGEPVYSVVRIDPKIEEPVATIPLDGRPEVVAAGKGRLWVATTRRPAEGGTLLEIDPVTNAIAGNPIDLPGSPSGLALAGGSVWVADYSGDVLRIDPQSHAVTATLEVGQGALVAGVGDWVWVATTRGDISRVELDGNRTTWPPIEVGWNVTGLAQGEGALWVTQTTPEEEFRVLRIDPRGGLAGEPIPLALNPTSPVIGGGSVWILQRAVHEGDLARDGTIVRIDPAQNRVVGDPIAAGAGSLGLAFGEGSLWVAQVDESVVLRIDPASEGESP